MCQFIRKQPNTLLVLFEQEKWHNLHQWCLCAQFQSWQTDFNYLYHWHSPPPQSDSDYHFGRLQNGMPSLIYFHLDLCHVVSGGGTNPWPSVPRRPPALHPQVQNARHIFHHPFTATTTNCNLRPAAGSSQNIKKKQLNTVLTSFPGNESAIAIGFLHVCVRTSPDMKPSRNDSAKHALVVLTPHF